MNGNVGESLINIEKNKIGNVIRVPKLNNALFYTLEPRKTYSRIGLDSSKTVNF